MTLSEAIKWRKLKERENVELARKYAKAKNYEVAASCYRGAGYHRAVREALEAHSRVGASK
jgi:hypothetical protein